MNITVVSSSTRQGRISHRIALALVEELKNRDIDTTLLDLEQLHLPEFEERFDNLENPSEEMKKAALILRESDAFIFVTPEYNGNISSGLKNFVDVYAKAPFDGKPIGVATGSTGAAGGIRAAYQLQHLILCSFGYPYPHMLLTAHMDQMLGENGEIQDAAYGEKLRTYLSKFLGFASHFRK